MFDYPRSVSFDDLYETAYRNEDLRCQTSIDPDEKDTDDIMQYFQSTTKAFAMWIEHNGIFAIRGDTLHYNIQNLPLLLAMLDRISWEYSSPDADELPDKYRLWNLLNMSGDDDVDYNCSYLAMAINIIDRHEQELNAKEQTDE